MMLGNIVKCSDSLYCHHGLIASNTLFAEMEAFNKGIGVYQGSRLLVHLSELSMKVLRRQVKEFLPALNIATNLQVNSAVAKHELHEAVDK